MALVAEGSASYLHSCLSFVHFPHSHFHSYTLMIPHSSDTCPFVSAYGPKQRVRLHFTLPDRTKQSFKDECDIHNILRRFELTGQLDHLQTRPQRFGEVPSIDFRQAMDVVVQSRADFAALPAKVRDRFANDPARFLEFVEDPANAQEGASLGLWTLTPTGEVSPPPAAAPASPAQS